ncbi:MAG: ABC transporter substrate-binding protein [Desulfarculus sp.]|nr:ABC transporter substrate-binding protein [Desulfarculus sp.]
MSKPCLIITILCILAGWCGWTAPPGHALERVAFRLHWVHQAQFAGYYLAQDLGLYQDAGLEVELRPGGPGQSNPLDDLRQGTVDFASSWLTEALVRHTQGHAVVNLAQIIQRSALLLVVFNESGIESPRDLTGRRVGLWRDYFAVPARALFSLLKMEVQEIDQNVSMSPFLNRAVTAATAMRYNEYHQLYQAGIDPEQLTIFDFAEMGLNFPEDGIYANAETWKKRPDVCRRFVQASLEGWRRAIADPRLALEAVMRRVEQAKLATNRRHQQWMLESMIMLVTYRTGAEGIGQLNPGDLALVNRILKEQGFLDRTVAYDGFAVPAWRKP